MSKFSKIVTNCKHFSQVISSTNYRKANKVCCVVCGENAFVTKVLCLPCIYLYLICFTCSPSSTMDPF